MTHTNLTEYDDNTYTCLFLFLYIVMLFLVVTSPEKSPDNSATIGPGAAVGGVAGAMLAVAAVTAVVVLTIYRFKCAKRKGGDV